MIKKVKSFIIAYKASKQKGSQPRVALYQVTAYILKMKLLMKLTTADLAETQSVTLIQ